MVPGMKGCGRYWLPGLLVAGLLVFAASTPAAEGEAENGESISSRPEPEDPALRAQERAALVEFYMALGGPDWLERDFWGSERPVGEWHGVETDAEGRATFLELPPGFAQVRLLRGGETQLRLVAGRTLEATLSIAGGAVVAGHVRDERGEPVAGAEIWLSERYRNNLGHVVARSDARGAFELRAVGPDHYLGARKRGFAPSALRFGWESHLLTM